MRRRPSPASNPARGGLAVRTIQSDIGFMSARKFILLLLLVPAAAEAQLVSQHVVGANRICRYHNPDQNRRQSVPLVDRIIGRGEPCPGRYVRVAPRPNPIPSMATLQRQERVEGRLVCTYEYLGRRYQRVSALGSTCPLTPLFPN